MKKRILSFLICIALILSCCPVVSHAASDEAIEAAWALYEMGLFGGTGTNADGTPNFDLDRTLSRVEAITMVVNLLGKREEALSGTWKTPFTDVPDWALGYVGYAYEHKLTSGTGSGKFDPLATADARQYLSFVLITMGYEIGKEFLWDEAVEFSDSIGLTSGEYRDLNRPFTRGDVAIVSYRSLSMRKGGDDPSGVKTNPPTVGAFAEVSMASEAQDPENYVISDLSFSGSGRQVSVTATASGPCHLRISILEEDQLFLRQSVEDDIEAAEENAVHTYTLKEMPPAAFVLTAVLTDARGNPLSELFVNRENTSAYQEFYALTPEDSRFEDRTVLDFDGSSDNNKTQTSNFAVLAEGVREEPTEWVTVSQDRMTYTFVSGLAPTAGEILYFSGADVPDILKVGSVTKKGESIFTVTRDTSASLGEFYDVIKLEMGAEEDADMQTVFAATPLAAGGVSGIAQPLSRSSIPEKSNDNLPSLTFSLGSSLTVEPFKLKTSGSYTVYLKLNRDKETLGDDYIYWEISSEGKLKVSGTVQFKVSNDDLAPDFENNSGEVSNAQIPDLNAYQHTMDGEHIWKLVDLGGPIPQVPGLNYNVSVAMNLTCKLAGSAGIEGSVTWKNGYIHEEGCTDKTKNTKEAKFEPKFKGKGTIFEGLEASVKVGLLDSTLYGELEAEIGLELEAQLDGTLMKPGAKPQGDSMHACDLCVDGDISLEISAKATLGYKLTKKISGKFINAKICEFKFPLAQFYCSIYNKWAGATEDSPRYGMGECPYRSYRVKFVSTLDGWPRDGANVNISCADGSDPPDPNTGTTPFELMLYPGTYRVDANLGSQELHTSFTVGNAPKTETLNFRNSNLQVTVVRADNGQPISNAAVDITEDAGGTISDHTDGDGVVVFHPTPGHYKVRVSMKGFQTAVTETTVREGDQSVRITLRKEEGTGTLEGLVVSETWQPLFDASITVHSVSDENQEDITLLSSRDGTFSTVLPVGDYELTCVKKGFANCTVSCTIVRDETVSQDIRMEDNPGNLHLTLNYPGGVIPENVRWGLLNPLTYERIAWGEFSGSDVLLGSVYNTRLDGGDYIFRLYPDGCAYYTQDITIDGETYLTVDISPITERNDGLCGDNAYWRLDGSTLIIFGHGDIYPDDVTRVCQEYGVTGVVVEDGITWIGLCLQRNENIVSLRLPNTLEYLSNTSFGNCSSLRDVIIPEGVLTMDDWAFVGCTSLTNITLPSTLSYIGYDAFEGCSSLTSIRIPDRISKLEKFAFKDCTSLSSIYIPRGTYLGWHVFEGCTSLETGGGIYYQGTEEQFRYDGLGFTGEGENRRDLNIPIHFNSNPDQVP